MVHTPCTSPGLRKRDAGDRGDLELKKLAQDHIVAVVTQYVSSGRKSGAFRNSQDSIPEFP